MQKLWLLGYTVSCLHFIPAACRVVYVPAAFLVEIFQADGAVFAALAASFLDVATAGFRQHAFAHPRRANVFIATLKGCVGKVMSCSPKLLRSTQFLYPTY